MIIKKGPLLGLLTIVLLNICAILFSGQLVQSKPVSSFQSNSPEHAVTQIIESTAESDYYLLARLIEAESAGEPYAGQVAVGAVALNRVMHSSFPDSIAGVIYQPGAFSSVEDGRIDAPAGRLACRAARDALNGLDPSGGAIYYYNRKGRPDNQFAEFAAVKIIGSRTFCRAA